MLKTSIKTLKCLTLLIVLLTQTQRNCAKTINDNNNKIIGSSTSCGKNNNSHTYFLLSLANKNKTLTTTIQKHEKILQKAQPSNKPNNLATLTAKCKSTHNRTVVNLKRNNRGELNAKADMLPYLSNYRYFADFSLENYQNADLPVLVSKSPDFSQQHSKFQSICRF